MPAIGVGHRSPCEIASNSDFPWPLAPVPRHDEELIYLANVAAEFIRPERNEQGVTRRMIFDLQNDGAPATRLASQSLKGRAYVLWMNR